MILASAEAVLVFATGVGAVAGWVAIAADQRRRPRRVPVVVPAARRRRR